MITWLRDAFEWALAAAAYKLSLRIPTGGKLWWKLLPTAGMYATTDSFFDYRSDRTGFLTCAPPKTGETP